MLIGNYSTIRCLMCEQEEWERKKMNFENFSDRGLEMRLYDLLLNGKSGILAPHYCSDYKLTYELADKYHIWVNEDYYPYKRMSYAFGFIGPSRDSIVVSNENTLRAIVICLIKKLEAENANR